MSLDFFNKNKISFLFLFLVLGLFLINFGWGVDCEFANKPSANIAHIETKNFDSVLNINGGENFIIYDNIKFQYNVNILSDDKLSVSGKLNGTCNINNYKKFKNKCVPIMRDNPQYYICIENDNALKNTLRWVLYKVVSKEKDESPKIPENNTPETSSPSNTPKNSQANDGKATSTTPEIFSWKEFYTEILGYFGLKN